VWWLLTGLLNELAVARAVVVDVVDVVRADLIALLRQEGTAFVGDLEV